MFEKIILTRLHLYPCCVIKACVREVTAQNYMFGLEEKTKTKLD